MSAEANKALIRRYFEAIDEACEAGHADIVDDFLAPDFHEHNPFPGIPATREGWKQAFREFVKGAPGHHVVEDLIAEGTRWWDESPPTEPTAESSSASPQPGRTSR